MLCKFNCHVNLVNRLCNTPNLISRQAWQLHMANRNKWKTSDGNELDIAASFVSIHSFLLWPFVFNSSKYLFIWMMFWTKISRQSIAQNSKSVPSDLRYAGNLRIDLNFTLHYVWPKFNIWQQISKSKLFELTNTRDRSICMVSSGS